MLQYMHEHLRGWIAGIVFFLISVSFVLWGVQYYTESSGRSSNTLVKVNGTKITELDLNKNLQQIQRDYIRMYGQAVPPAQMEYFKRYALENLINQNVLTLSAQRAGFRISQEQVNQAIMSFPQFQEKGQFSIQRYRELLAANSLTPTEFNSQINNFLLTNQPRMGIRDTSFILSDEANTGYDLQYERRSFRYVVLPVSRFMASKSATVTPQMIETYYQQHSESYKSPEKVSISFIHLSPEKIREQITVSEAEIKEYYQNNINHYRNKDKTQALDTVKDDIKKILVQQKVNDIMTQKSDTLANLSYTHSDSLEPASQALHIPIEASPFFTQETRAQRDAIWSHPKIVATAFNEEILQGNNSDPVELPDGSIVVLRLKERKAAHLMALKAVETQIKDQLSQKLAQVEAAVTAQKIQNALNQKQSVDMLAQKYQIQWVTKNNILRDNKNIKPEILSSVFEMSAMQGANTKISTLSNGDAFVIELTHTDLPKPKERVNKNLEAIKKEMTQQMGDLEYRLYEKSARQAAKIKIMASKT